MMVLANAWVYRDDGWVLDFQASLPPRICNIAGIIILSRAISQLKYIELNLFLCPKVRGR